MSVKSAPTENAGAPLRYRVDDLLVDVGRRSVSRDGVVLDVTGRSFDLLLALVRAAPNVVSLDQLMTDVWRRMVVNNETVTHRVKVLREALGDQPEQPRYIASVRGHGYRLLSQAVPLTLEAGSPASELDYRTQNESTSDPAQASKAQRSPTVPRYIRFVVAAVVILILLVAGVWWNRTHTQSPPVARDSVAVLPFANMTGDASKDYLGDGMAEELINTLSKVPGLKVPARTSSFVYKGRNVSIRDIAKDLQVGTILEGSVRTAGTRIRITAQLINVQDGLHLWSQTYDEEFGDLFKLQDELATTIAMALQPNLSGNAIASVVQTPPTRDVEAYNLYLQGVSLVNRTSPENAARAIDYFQRALARDPKFARAYAMIAEAESGWAQVDPTRFSEHGRAAERAARQALAMDPNLANAHTTLAGVDTALRRPLEAAAHARAAVTLAPNDGFVRILAALQLGAPGYRRQAIEEAKRAYVLAPDNPFVAAFVALLYSQAGDEAEARKYANTAHDLGFPPASNPLSAVDALSALRAGRYAEAADIIDAAIDESDPDQVRAEQTFRAVIAALADPKQRDAVLNPTTGSFHDEFRFSKSGPCLESGLSYVLLGAIDIAYERTNRCLELDSVQIFFGGFPNLWRWWTPELRAFRADPRFQTFAERMGLMEYYRQYGPPDDCDLKDGKLTCH